MARKTTTRAKIGFSIAAWAVALLLFFPILYAFLTSLKTEPEAIAGFSLIPSGTLENYITVQTQRDYFKPFMNSVVLSLGSTIIALIIAIPAAWAMAFSPTKRTKDILMWMLSTKMMPAVAVLVPIYLIFRNAGLLDTRIGLTVMLTFINLPIVVWMLYTYFREIPGEILEAARMDGASLWNEIVHVLTGHCLDASPQHHPRLERSFLDHPAVDHQCGTADGLHRLLLLTAGAVLGQALGRLDDGDRPHSRHRLVLAETTRAWPHLWRREIRNDNNGQHFPSERVQALRRGESHPVDRSRYP